MKHIKHSVTALMLLLLLTNSQCKKKTEEPQLPPVTTTGAMTFGCKINGKVFVPHDGRGKPGLFCQYVNLGNVPDGGWHLNIPSYNYSTSMGVSIETDSLFLIEGQTYDFKTTRGTANAFYITNTSNGGVDVFNKIDNDSGSLYVLKHDQTLRVLSGTFSFVGTNQSSGNKIYVTDGRFDIRY